MTQNWLRTSVVAGLAPARFAFAPTSPSHNRALSFLQVMCHCLVVVPGGIPMDIRIGVDNRLGEACNTVEEAMADLLGNGVCLRQRQLCIHLYVHDYLQRVPDPACAYIGNFLYSWHLACCRYDGRDDAWVNPIEQTL